MKLAAVLLALAACASGSRSLTRGQAYDAVRPASCDRILRCAPDQYARDYTSREDCVAAKRPGFPRSAELSECDRDEATACVNAQNQEPCHAGPVAACEGC